MDFGGCKSFITSIGILIYGLVDREMDQWINVYN